ncbi:MAG: JDVT-CTERM system glutamic-type intramembrane protease [Pseudomonadota bacterium]
MCGPARERLAWAWVDVFGLVGLGVAAVWLPWPWVVLCGVVPLCEELVFRSGLQETLLRRGWSGWAAIGLTALVFTVLHGLLRSWTLAWGVALPALWLGWVYHRSRARSGPVMAWRQCVAWHAGFNSIYWVWVQRAGLSA